MTQLMPRAVTAMLVFGLALGLTACEEPSPTEDKPLIRAIKNMTLEVRAGAQQRVLTGETKADLTSNAAFEVSGQVIRMTVDVGDQVTKGTVLAQLDPEPYTLTLRQAESELVSANADLEDANRKFEQQSELFGRGFATKTNFDSAEARKRSAEAAVDAAESQVALARRNLSKTELKAPFDGVIATKSVEVFEEVSPGQTLYALQSGDPKVEATLPETLISVVGINQQVIVSFPPLGGATASGRIDEIAPLAGDANAYPIEIALDDRPEGLRAGMSAEIVLEFATQNTGTAFMVPYGAVKARGAAQSEATVFVFDATTGTVSEVSVSVVDVQDNVLQIVGDDLAAGNIIATAGVSFLHDGMQVTLFDDSVFE
ncbi:MAG: efflux RND transporter periplasmic adaptor subunit [Alphaproteobacteria bacterium]|nr:efflux RND transporter periplasmic adaptor subunit [Alphaproteobacteria bacterium]